MSAARPEERPRCKRPPPGWRCTRDADHDGPCAALPVEGPRIPPTLEGIAASLEVCIIRTELAVSHASRAAEAAERTEAHVAMIRKVAQRQANDYAYLRHGIPASWVGRFALAGAAAIVGAIAAVVVVACGVATPISHETPTTLAP